MMRIFLLIFLFQKKSSLYYNVLIMGKLCNELENINHLISLVRDLEVGQFFISNVSGLDLSDDTETRSQWHYCDMMLLNGVSIQYA